MKLPIEGITMALGKSTLSVATTKFTTVATVVSIDGEAVTFAANTAASWPTEDANTGETVTPLGDNEATVYVIYSNAAGVEKMAQGSVAALDNDTLDYINDVPQFPPTPDGLCPVGYMVVKNTSGSDFVLNTTSVATSGITEAVTSVCTLPERPDAA